MIHGDKFAAFAHVEINCGADGVMVYRGVDRIGREPVIAFVKTDYLNEFFTVLEENQGYPVILISHNSDYAVTKEVYESAPPCVKRWYALNVDYAVDDLIPIPSGMERPKGGGYSARPDVITRAWDAGARTRAGVFCCWNVNNNHAERATARKQFASMPGTVVREHGTSFEGFIDHCFSARFVASPPGNGIDCHRTWEAMYCGAIPIVKRSVHTEKLFDLPMLIVEDWGIVSEKVLNLVWDGHESVRWNHEKLSMTYWRDRIRRDFARWA